MAVLARGGVIFGSSAGAIIQGSFVVRGRPDKPLLMAPVGIGIDDDAALLVRQNVFEVIGTGRVAIYDNVRHDGSWYYFLKPGEQFDLSSWTKIER